MPTINALSVSGTSLLLNSVSGDIGFNNNTYKVNVADNYQISYQNSDSYLTLSGGTSSNISLTITTSYTITDFVDDFYVYIYISTDGNQSLVKAKIDTIETYNTTDLAIYITGSWINVDNKTGDVYIQSVDSEKYEATKNGPAIFYQGTGYNNNGVSYETNKQSGYLPNTTTVVLQHLDTAVQNMLLTNTTHNIVIGSVSDTFDVNKNKSTNWYSSGTTPIVLNFLLPLDQVNKPLKLFAKPNGSDSTGNFEMSNSFVASTNAPFQLTYKPPTLDFLADPQAFLDEVFTEYMPTLLGGGDYTVVAKDTSYIPYWASRANALMDSDMCRMPWRLANYVRAEKTRTSTDKIIKIAKQVATALYTAASPTTNLPLGVDVYTLTFVGNGISGDMMPPFLALVDALYIRGYFNASDPIVVFANSLKRLNVSEDLATMISNVTHMYTAPLYDSYNTGGQQHGLAGVSMVCMVDFLRRTDVMPLYDTIGGDSTNTYPANVLSDTEYANCIQVYKMAWMRGNGFSLYSAWGAGASIDYGTAIISNAYLTNMRIRGINISKANELCFGPDSQNTKTITGDSYYANGGYNDPGNGYVPTYFPIYGIPDSGWQSITVEILSYVGVTLVGIDDYVNFCRWHRLVYFLLFQQNGGDMFNWSTDVDDKIVKFDSVPSVKSKNGEITNFWIPEFLEDDTDNDLLGYKQGGPNWVNDLLGAGKIHYFSIYNWPPNPSPNGPPLNSDKTGIWANRWNPYRGDNESNKVQWSRPSYCMGYSPGFVVGGKTLNTWSSDNDVNRPVAEALNPHFIATGGLYSATDGDNNLFIAYKLASLKWTTAAPSSAASINPGVKYDCDLADFQSVVVQETTDTTGYGAGVYQAVCDLESKHGYQDAVTYLTDVIGYGMTPGGGDKTVLANWVQKKGDSESSSVRTTTWEYIANAMQRTMISNRGNGFDGEFGNFAPNANAPKSGTTGARIVTLGHDTSASANPIKMDYQDTRLYEVNVHDAY